MVQSSSINPPGPHLISMAFSVLPVAIFLLSGAESTPNTMKRSDDPDPLIAMVQQLSVKIANLEARQSADEARLSKYRISSVPDMATSALKVLSS